MLIRRNDIESLAKIQFTNCISLYVPTHRSGFDNSKIDRLKFKNALNEAKEQLEARAILPDEIKSLLRPAHELLDDEAFWTRLSDGLAVFISPDHFKHFELPVPFNSLVYVGSHFYLRPLTPMFVGDGRYFLLAISQNELRFFEASRHGVTPVVVKDLVPENIKEALAYSEKELSLQMHSGTGSSSVAIYHGQGGGKDRKNNDLKKYFRRIDDGLMKMLHDENAPLLIAAVDYLLPLYKEVSRYSNIMDFHLTGNPEEKSPVQLHEKSWLLMEPYFKKRQLEAKEQFDALLSKNQAGVSISEVVPASINGRVETLFINKDEDFTWGFYNEAGNEVKIHEERLKYSDCLLNLSAIKVFLQGGDVYNVSAEEMPFGHAPMNAVYRF